MENQPTNIEELFRKLKEYGDTRIDLFKLKSINKAAYFFSTITTSIVLLSLVFLVLIFFSIGLALLIGDLLGHLYWGFFIMSGLFIIIGLVFYFSRNKIIKTPITNTLIKSLMD